VLPVAAARRPFEPADAAAVAAHDGSVSAVTFVVGLASLDGAGIAVEGFMPALLAVMEAPGIAAAVLLAILSASANSIAAAAALRLALPEANPAFTLTAALAVAFPFNLALRLLLYAALARAFAGGG
jgi:hypothetical protein